MTSERSGRRVGSRLAGVVSGRRAAEERAEILRQLSDVFKELAHLSVDIGAVFRSLEETKVTIAQLGDAVTERTEVGNESLELLGRLLESARARIEALEEEQSRR